MTWTTTTMRMTPMKVCEQCGFEPAPEFGPLDEESHCFDCRSLPAPPPKFFTAKEKGKA
jgi:predicted Zn-ribbon and HTH transcriptional regulator